LSVRQSDQWLAAVASAPKAKQLSASPEAEITKVDV
jgi:hypothetical protein